MPNFPFKIFTTYTTLNLVPPCFYLGNNLMRSFSLTVKDMTFSMINFVASVSTMHLVFGSTLTFQPAVISLINTCKVSENVSILLLP
ncbi:unnamed protein product [Trifolium pratense]|uniref:Uncharacterized protein n=1 Tax=Trifolium pratense TaxID=57577 RepID=A0ACB0LJR7_TRIPR|nr:unnamed protein product [Trifolium pratense]